ncbi:N-succinylarginine dihydrolase [bacterium]|jgi:succinylarginine dihydrolase|nr:N-succinylarginine dihydrolase [bacterium]
MVSQELNLDGLIGPTHFFGGLAYGNQASMAHQNQVSHPKSAAIQGLQKMKVLMDLGIPQGVLPPHERPYQPYLSDPEKRHHAFSASSMWAANAATISPSSDTPDSKVHITPANLQTCIHRRIEAPFTTDLLRTLFDDRDRFQVHESLPATLPDEGAANHTRLCKQYGDRGIHLFVYGTSQSTSEHPSYPARQSLESSQAIAKQHGLSNEGVYMQQESLKAIDSGGFHNDVVGVGNQTVYIYHEMAYTHPLTSFHSQAETILDAPLHFLMIPSETLPLDIAIRSYFFNSQIVTLSSGKMVFIVPSDCLDYPEALNAIAYTLSEIPIIQEVVYVDVRQSMQNGGGPACLRLRVVLTPSEQAAMHQGVLLTNSKVDTLIQWVETHYRETLSIKDLEDPHLIEETHRALDSLSAILGLGSIYPFQKSDS